ncbi:MAG TPA: AI-2E family transporter, partial [Solirubrobacteraceae bacterium]|nr:AI-2E family transporter [Solirubrobacteraceae bacterium]
MSEESGTPEQPDASSPAQPPTGAERDLVDAPATAEVEPPRLLVPRWVQLVLLPVSLLALWALARAAGKVLLIFVVAALIALVLNPLVAFLQHRTRLPRGLAVLTVYLAFFLTLVGVGFLLANPIADQIRTFTHNLPGIVNEANSQIASFQHYLNKHGVHAKLVSQGKTALQTLQDQVSKSAGKLATFGGALLSEVAKALVDLVLVFVLSVYMLIYGQTISGLVRRAMPPGDGTRADDYPALAQH